ncbi:MAG: metal-dependent hydrolase [Nannocystaceae bacterium]|nr:metal-dependent hydrolase [Nannocystaceae bacterium]
MDSITQGLLGAAAAQAVLARRLGPRTWRWGALGGMAADLDILIRSSDDPLVALVWHRHFTHSLAFVPLGGLLCALPWLLRKRWRADRWAILAATTIGYATHGLLDAFTTYGTQLWWPFSSTRVAWDWVAIVDPIYSGILFAGVWLSRRRRSPRSALAALIASSMYLALGGVLHARAVAAARQLAQSRGHVLARVDAFPQLPVDFVWRTAYRANGRIWIDEARTPWFGAVRIREGESLPVVDPEQPGALADGLASDRRAAEALRTFAWFADGWIARAPGEGVQLVDLRYGTAARTVAPLWTLELRPGTTQPAVLHTTRPAPGEFARARWSEIVGD